MTKKGGVVGTVILFIIFLLVIGAIVYIVIKYDKKEPEIIIKQNILFKAVDKDSGQQLEASYCVYKDLSQLVCGTTSSSSLTQVSLQSDNYTIEIMHNDYYNLIQDVKLFDSSIETTFLLTRYGQPIITYQPDLFTQPTTILSLNTSFFFQNPTICFRWSKNIVNVDIPEQKLSCYTNLSKTGSTYQCDYSEKTYYCDSIKENLTIHEPKECFLTRRIPKRLEYKVDKCYRLQNDITRTPLELQLTITGNEITPSDYINIYLLDEAYILSLKRYDLEYENGSNLGMPDFKFTIP